MNQTWKYFTVGTAPKSSQIPSSSPLLSWCESVRLCLIQLTYSNVHWFKSHLMCQSMSTGLLGCLSLSQKITFFLKREGDNASEIKVKKNNILLVIPQICDV